MANEDGKKDGFVYHDYHDSCYILVISVFCSEDLCLTLMMQPFFYISKEGE